MPKPLPLNRYTRFMRPDEQAVIKSWRKLDPEVDEFYFCWQRWKKWEQEPPIVVTDGVSLVGYHGVSFNARVYANSASQFVLPDYRGRGLAGAMIDMLLREARARGLQRLRFRTPLTGPGYDCWAGFGVKPFGEGQGDYWFDLALIDVANLQDLISKGPTLHLTPTTDKRRLNYYRRAGIRCLVPALQDYTCSPLAEPQGVKATDLEYTELFQ